MKTFNLNKQDYNTLNHSEITLREEISESDRENIKNILKSSGCFYPFEIDTAISLYDERLEKGISSGYHFLILEKQNVLLGYSCYGLIPCTKSSFDLYWIAIDQAFRNQGLGVYLMNETEKRISTSGGSNIYIETSSREIYCSARYFYTKCGYTVVANFPDFYNTTDDKIVFKKELTSKSNVKFNS